MDVSQDYLADLLVRMAYHSSGLDGNTTSLPQMVSIILEVLSDTHIKFERIHPFSDGNGRTGRLIVMYPGMKYLGVPIVIRKERWEQYMEYLGEQDSKSIAKLFRESLVLECERMADFQ